MKKNLFKNFPITEVRIENTNFCNATCVMCPRDLTRKMGIMPFSLFKKIIDECAQLQIPSIHLHGHGEPLIDKGIYTKIEYAKKKGIPETLIITNGSLLTPAISKKLIESGLDNLIISHHAGSQESFDVIHRGLDFKSTRENIASFFHTKREMGSLKPKTHLYFIEQKENLGEKESYLKYWKNIADNIMVSDYLHNYGAGQKFQPVRKDIDRVSCGRFFFLKIMQILWDGSVIPCCFDTDGKIVFGNVHQETLMDVWKGKKFKTFRKEHARGHFEKYPLCDNCEQLDPKHRLPRAGEHRRNLFVRVAKRIDAIIRGGETLRFARMFLDLLLMIRRARHGHHDVGYDLLLKKTTYWIYANRGERLDANVFLSGSPDRRDFHKDRYLFAVNKLAPCRNDIQLILDAGCGLGYGTRILADKLLRNVVGADIEAKAVRYAKETYAHPTCRYECADLTRREAFRPECFDAVVSFEAIEHLEDPLSYLENLAFWLKEAGRLIISTPNDWGKTQYHKTNYTYELFIQHVERYFCVHEIFVQNSGSKDVGFNRGESKRLVLAGEKNLSTAEVFIAICEKRKN